MTDKPTGSAAAAWEISDLIDIGFVTQHQNKRVPTIESIILKHCPEDKGAEKLVEACNKMAGFLIGWKECLAGLQMTDKEFDDSSGLQEARDALAEYEKVNK